jgi:D-lactate dehydrogenase (cytochrome)
MLKKFRHLVPELINADISELKKTNKNLRKIGTDTAIPEQYFCKVFLDSISLIEQELIHYVAFGHLGDFHIHINMLPQNQSELERALLVYDTLMSFALKNGGTISAEHGIGKLKKKYLEKMYGSEGIKQMHAIKHALDPLGILNPGNLF